MKALIQRVSEAEVEIGGTTFSRIGRGLLVFLGVERGDTDRDLAYLAKKIAHLRIFEDMERKMNRSVQDADGEILVVSQFTLAADCRKGNRPSFDSAEDPSRAKVLYEQFVEGLRAMGIRVRTGEFGATMRIRLVNDGPVSILIDSRR